MIRDEVIGGLWNAGVDVGDTDVGILPVLRPS